MYSVYELAHDESIELAVQRKKYREEVVNLKSASSYSHLNSANMDWNTECQWDKESAFSMKMCDADSNIVGLLFFNHTLRSPRHWTLRHIIVLEEYRKIGAATHLLKYFYKFINEHNSGVEWLRFFSDKKSVGFYDKFNFYWLGLSKSGLPFTYTKIMDNDPKTSNDMFNAVRNVEFRATMTNKKVRSQISKLKEVWHKFPEDMTNLSQFI